MDTKGRRAVEVAPAFINLFRFPRRNIEAAMAGLVITIVLTGCGAGKTPDSVGSHSTMSSHETQAVPHSVLVRESQRLHAKVSDLSHQRVIVDDWNIADNRLHITLDQRTKAGSDEILRSAIGSMGLDIIHGGVMAEAG